MTHLTAMVPPPASTVLSRYVARATPVAFSIEAGGKLLVTELVAESTSPREVHTLLCHRDVKMGLMTLGSLLRLSHDPLHLVVHDDGSLTQHDVDELSAALQCDVLIREEADDRMASLLRSHPAARAYRDGDQVWALKLLDCCLLATSDISYLDSDILFFRPFRGLFDGPSTGGAVMMADIRDAWSLSPKAWLEAPRLLPSRLNAGLMHFNEGAYELEFIEWFAAKRRYNALPEYTEQTCLAALAKRAGVLSYDTDQIKLVTAEADARLLIAGHYTTPFRSWIWDAAGHAVSADDDEPVPVRMHAAEAAKLTEVVRSGLRYRAGVRKHRLLRQWEGRRHDQSH